MKRFALLFFALFTYLVGIGQSVACFKRWLTPLSFGVKSTSLNQTKPFSVELFNQSKIMKLGNAPEKLPFFCSMENKFSKKFNLFLVLRAGNDEQYRKLTGNKTY